MRPESVAAKLHCGRRLPIGGYASKQSLNRHSQGANVKSQDHTATGERPPTGAPTPVALRAVSAHWFICLWFCYAARPLELQLQQEHIQVVRSNTVALKRPARGHSRNRPWTWRHTHNDDDFFDWGSMCTYIGTKKRNRTKNTSINSQHDWLMLLLLLRKK